MGTLLGRDSSELTCPNANWSNLKPSRVQGCGVYVDKVLEPEGETPPTSYNTKSTLFLIPLRLQVVVVF